MVNRITLAPFDVEKCEHWFDGIDRVFFDVNKTDIFGLFPGAYFVFDPPYMATNCDDYDKKETLHILADIVTQVRRGGFILFGDSSASFCYDLIVENRPHKKFEKLLGSIFGIKRRVEVLYTDLNL